MKPFIRELQVQVPCCRCVYAVASTVREWFLEMRWKRESQVWINICYKFWTKRSNFWVIDLKAFWTWSLWMQLALAAVHHPMLSSHGRTPQHCKFLQQSSTTWDILGIYPVSKKNTHFFFLLWFQQQYEIVMNTLFFILWVCGVGDVLKERRGGAFLLTQVAIMQTAF